jgi:hypothetical protein
MHASACGEGLRALREMRPRRLPEMPSRRGSTGRLHKTPGVLRAAEAM